MRTKVKTLIERSPFCAVADGYLAELIAAVETLSRGHTPTSSL
jgi:hypothetical protein